MQQDALHVARAQACAEDGRDVPASAEPFHAGMTDGEYATKASTDGWASPWKTTHPPVLNAVTTPPSSQTEESFGLH